MPAITRIFLADGLIGPEPTWKPIAVYLISSDCQTKEDAGIARMAAMRDAVARRDAEALWQAAHKLKGGCFVIGVEGLAKICSDLEAMGRSGLWQGASKKIARAEQEHERAKAALQEYGKDAGHVPGA